LRVFRVTFPGPFSSHDVVVDGWKVPLVHAHPAGENGIAPKTNNGACNLSNSGVLYGSYQGVAATGTVSFK
jgi:hypothetical protein